MKNVLINMVNVKSGGQITYLVNLLNEVVTLTNYKFTFLINGIAEKYLKNITLTIPENARIYAIPSSYSYGATSYVWQVFNLPRIVREVRPDYVYAPTHIAYKVRGIKTILAMRNMAIPNCMRIDVPLRMRLNLCLKYLPLNYSLRKADKVVAVSYYVRDFLKDVIRKDENDIFVAYHMVNDLHRENESLLERYDNIDKNDYVIFIPGSYYQYKKFHLLLNYLESLDLPENTKIVFAGDEADKNYLNRLRRHKSKTYTLILKSNASMQQMKFLYKIARLVILSSQIEACPNIAIEALANKSKVLASNIPPFKEIMGNYAVYFDNNNMADFHKKFVTAISSTPREDVYLKQIKKIRHADTIAVLDFCEAN